MNTPAGRVTGSSKALGRMHVWSIRSRFVRVDDNMNKFVVAAHYYSVPVDHEADFFCYSPSAISRCEQCLERIYINDLIQQSSEVVYIIASCFDEANNDTRRQFTFPQL